MGTALEAWHICWAFTSACWQCSTSTQSKNRIGLTSISCGIDQFTTVSHMRALTVPPNWEQLVRQSRELVTTEQFDLTKTWFESENDITADTVLQPLNENDSIANLQDTIDRSQADTVPDEASTLANEGVKTNLADAAVNEGDPNTSSFNNLCWSNELENR